MLTFHTVRIHRWLALAIGFAILFLALQAEPVYAQPPTCNDVITQLDGALAPGVCDVLGLGSACLATRSVSATPRTGTIRFTAPGDEAQLNNIQRMATVPQKGAAVLLGGSTANPVKILVFGDTATSPNTTQPGRVFTLRASNGQPSCERTRSGMILQTPNGKNGTLVVNGVTIKLGSTAYVVPGADLLFDQDPRIDRRKGSRNRNAPLCSGFDSDCSFGDDYCSRSDRLVYGPFCREDTYSYIEPGLYRVTLYGEGEVQAGATDFNISHDFEMMGTQRLTLPGSYTFCWDGLQDGGTGFETIVQARSDNAAVDHITVEFLGHDCSLPGANDPSAGTGSGEMGVMSVYNIDGGVDVSMPDGEQASTRSGQRIRLYYEGDQPVAMDEGPTNAPYIQQSDLAQWASGATGGGLPEVRIGTGRPGSEPKPVDPVVSINADVLYDGDSPYALRIEAQAYDPAVGSNNGDGIDHVHFAISDSSGDIVFESDEQNPPYCAFGGGSTCQESISSDSFAGGEYQVTATAYANSGRQALATTSFTLSYATTTSESDPVVSLDAEVLRDGSYPTALHIEAQAYDPAVGSNNGDGIDHIHFTISDPSGDIILDHDEGTPAYCAYGGDSPCEEPISSDSFASGDYQVTATAYANSGREATASATFALDFGTVGSAGGESSATVDSTPPSFGPISTTPSGEYCFDDTISVGVDVRDDVSTAHVTFHWLLLDVDPEFPQYGGYPYDTVDLGSGNGNFQAELSVGKLNSANFYFTAIDDAGNEATSETINMTGKDCGPVVK